MKWALLFPLLPVLPHGSPTNFVIKGTIIVTLGRLIKFCFVFLVAILFCSYPRKQQKFCSLKLQQKLIFMLQNNYCILNNWLVPTVVMKILHWQFLFFWRHFMYVFWFLLKCMVIQQMKSQWYSSLRIPELLPLIAVNYFSAHAVSNPFMNNLHGLSMV